MKVSEPWDPLGRYFIKDLVDDLFDEGHGRKTMSDLVEKLAEKWDEYISTVEPHPTMELPQIEARWWLNAIADELHAHPEHEMRFGDRPHRSMRGMARWLRSQANGGDDG